MGTEGVSNLLLSHSAAMNELVHRHMCAGVSVGQIPRSGIAGSKVTSKA